MNDGLNSTSLGGNYLCNLIKVLLEVRYCKQQMEIFGNVRSSTLCHASSRTEYEAVVNCFSQHSRSKYWWPSRNHFGNVVISTVHLWVAEVMLMICPSSLNITWSNGLHQQLFVVWKKLCFPLFTQLRVAIKWIRPWVL